MGFFSGVKKVISKAAPIVGTAVGAMYGNPAAGAAGGSAISSIFGGGDNSAKQQSTGYGWLDTGLSMANSAADLYGAYQSIMNTKDASERARAMEKLQMGAYDNSLQGIMLQNATAKQLADEANQFNAQQVLEARHYNTAMAGSAHQREVADLRAAGLNPILSGTGGMGAASPAAPTATANVAPVRSQGDAISSAFDAFSKMADAMKASAATTFMSGAQTANVQQQTRQSAAQTELTGEQSKLTNAQRVKTIYEAANVLATNPRIKQEVQNLKAIHDNYVKTGRLTEAQTNQVKQSTANMSQIYKDLRMKGDISNSELGRILEIGKRTTDVTGNLNSLIKIFGKK